MSEVLNRTADLLKETVPVDLVERAEVIKSVEYWRRFGMDLFAGCKEIDSGIPGAGASCMVFGSFNYSVASESFADVYWLG